MLKLASKLFFLLLRIAVVAAFVNQLYQLRWFDPYDNEVFWTSLTTNFLVDICLLIVKLRLEQAKLKRSENRIA